MRWCFAATALTGASIAFAGCGGSSSDRDKIRASDAGFYAALAKHDAATACSYLTTAYWRATRQDIELFLASQPARPEIPSDCTGVLKFVFQAAGAGSLAPKGVKVTDISIRGMTATATLVSPGAPRPVHFVRDSAGRWRIDCCTGPQLDQQPTASYRVPSSAMEPTLKVGQIVTSDNAALRAHPPALGDIIVFHPPTNADAVTAASACVDHREGGTSKRPCGVAGSGESAEVFIKRVVGLPGDRIALRGGRVLRNGQVASEPFIKACAGGAGGGPGCDFPDPIVVPAGTYYVLGDNRPASDDSRFWGPIRRTWIVGMIKP
jgi:signal peptidase I